MTSRVDYFKVQAANVLTGSAVGGLVMWISGTYGTFAAVATMLGGLLGGKIAMRRLAERDAKAKS